MEFNKHGYWALILGGSSGFGLASARNLSECGMNIFVVHRDLRGAMPKIEPEFAAIRSTGVAFEHINTNALTTEGRNAVLDSLTEQAGLGKVRLVLHSVAAGSLKLLAPYKASPSESMNRLAESLGMPRDELQAKIDLLFEEGADDLADLASGPRFGEAMTADTDVLETIYSMGSSLLTWVQDLHARGLFAPIAQVVGLTSAGNAVAWRGYAAVSAAKAALESVARSIALEFAPYGIRCNILQPGITDTPALRRIPGNLQMRAKARSRNPFGRLTCPEDVAKVVALICTDEAEWINGAIIPVDGGEHVVG